MGYVERLDAIHARLAEIRYEYLGLTNGRRAAMEEEIEALYAEKRTILATPALLESRKKLEADRALFTEPPKVKKVARGHGIRAPQRDYQQLLARGRSL